MREFLHTYMNIAELNILKTLSSKCRKTKFSIVFLHKLKIFMQSCDLFLSIHVLFRNI